MKTSADWTPAVLALVANVDAAKASLAAAQQQLKSNGPVLLDYRTNSAVYAYCDQLRADLRDKETTYFGVGALSAGAAGVLALVGASAAIAVAAAPGGEATTTTVETGPDGKTQKETTETTGAAPNATLITTIGVVTTGVVAIAGLFASSMFSASGQANEAVGDLEIRKAEVQRKTPSTLEQAHYVELLAACRTAEGKWHQSREGVVETLIQKQLK